MLINFYDQVPRVYPNSSRDFQYLSWLINIVLNSVKHNVDDLYDLPNAAHDAKLTELLAMTLGFKIRRNYDQKQLAALVSVIPGLLKHKGTAKAISMAADALITASGTVGNFECIVRDNELEIVLPKELVDTTLFMDLLPYIMPAGMTCKVLRKTQIQINRRTEIDYRYNSKYSWQRDKNLATLFTVSDDNDLTFAYHKKDEETLNAGLLDTTIIPALTSNAEINTTES